MQQGKDLRAGRNHWTAAGKASGASVLETARCLTAGR